MNCPALMHYISDFMTKICLICHSFYNEVKISLMLCHCFDKASVNQKETPNVLH